MAYDVSFGNMHCYQTEFYIGLSHAGATISPKKSQVARPRITLVGQTLTYNGRLPDTSRISKILKCLYRRTRQKSAIPRTLQNTSHLDLELFLKHDLLQNSLATILRSKWTTSSTRSLWHTQEAISTPPVLRPIDYTSDQPVVLSVDSCPIATGIILHNTMKQVTNVPARYDPSLWTNRSTLQSTQVGTLWTLSRSTTFFDLLS